MSVLKSYNSRVLLGNWWEERILEKEKNSELFSRNEDQLSTTQFLKLLIESIPTMIECSPLAPDMHLRSGYNVQILNPGPSPFYLKSGLAAPRALYALGLSIKEMFNFSLMISNSGDNLFRTLEKDGLLCITASNNVQPSARNIFQICCLRENQFGKVIRYGEPILLRIRPDIISSRCNSELQKKFDTDQYFYLASDLRHLGDKDLLPDAQRLYFEVGRPSFLSQWRLEYEDPHLRKEFEGRPVNSDQRLLIKHVRSNKAIALEPNFIVHTLFGHEVNLTVRTYYDSHKLERDVNFWMLSSSKQHDLSSILNEQEPHKVLENTSLEGDCAAGSNLCSEKQVYFDQNTNAANT